MENFTPIAALIGGALIGLSAVGLMASHGRVAGISGIIGGSLNASDRQWRWAFLAGLILAPAITIQIAPSLAKAEFPVGKTAIIIAAMCVGIGTQLGNGCTSGHGVCGNARLSRRSIAATLTFMATGVLTVFIVRHGLGV